MRYLVKRKMNARIENYLKGYNLLQLAGWSTGFLFLFIDMGVAYRCIALFQLLSLAEILHASKKWSQSSSLFCFLQIGARLMILYIVLKLSFHTKLYPIPSFNEVLYTMFIAWCTAEVIRYAYYVSVLFKRKDEILAWLRYTAFILCYPVGLASEFYFLSRVYILKPYPNVRFLLVVVFLMYAIAFPMLYLHLLKQRKRKLK